VYSIRDERGKDEYSEPGFLCLPSSKQFFLLRSPHFVLYSSVSAVFCCNDFSQFAHKVLVIIQQKYSWINVKRDISISAGKEWYSYLSDMGCQCICNLETPSSGVWEYIVSSSLSVILSHMKLFICLSTTRYLFGKRANKEIPTFLVDVCLEQEFHRSKTPL
jgi:hypothetical protein